VTPPGAEVERRGATSAEAPPVRAEPPAQLPAAAGAPRVEGTASDAARDARDGARALDARRLAACLSLTAGAIHAIATIDHFSHIWLYGAVFLVFTYGQVLWGMAVLRGRLGRRGLVAGLVANLAIVALWAVSRTVGVPLGPEAGDPEPLGTMDIAATVDELALVAYVLAVVRPDLRVRRGMLVLLGAHRIRLGVALCSASFFAALLGGHAH
jgi:hypothetical protein